MTWTSLMMMNRAVALAILLCLAARAATAEPPPRFEGRPTSGTLWPSNARTTTQSPVTGGGVRQAAYEQATDPGQQPQRFAPAAGGTQPLDAPALATSTPLAPPGKKLGTGRSTAGGSAVGTALASLAVVLGLFFTVAWLLRRGMPPASAVLPDEVVEVLGRAPLPGRQQAHLVRLGSKLLLISMTAQGAETLGEITDPEEVERLSEICRRSGSRLGATFRAPWRLAGRFGNTEAERKNA